MTITQETRQMSFEDISEQRKQRYKQILDNLNEPMTAKELAVKLYEKGLIPTSERNFTAPRLSELEYRGEVEVIDKKKCSYTGKKVAVYRKVVYEEFKTTRM